MTEPDPIRLAVVGGRRGRHFNKALDRLSEKIQLVAVCDVLDDVLTAWKEQYPDARTYRDYSDLLSDSDVDAVFLATPLTQHASQAIAALESGKHVLSEVIASHTLEDSWALIEAVERSGLTYMLAENYCYMRPNLMVENIASQGLFGRITHLEGAYIHDCRKLLHYPDGSLTWRGQLRADYDSIYYPTHSLGPVARWLRAANGPDDRLESVAAFTSGSDAVRSYFAEHFGADHPGAKDEGYWKQGDSGTVVIQTTSGAVITLRVDAVSARPHNMTHYGVQGTTGAYISARRTGEDPILWLDSADGADPEWQSLWDRTSDFEHPRWRQWLSVAQEAGHGGGDFFVIDEFADAVRQKRTPDIDVYDAVTWSSVFPLSVQSIALGGRPIEFPEFIPKRTQ